MVTTNLDSLMLSTHRKNDRETHTAQSMQKHVRQPQGQANGNPIRAEAELFIWDRTLECSPGHRLGSNLEVKSVVNAAKSCTRNEEKNNLTIIVQVGQA